MSKHTIADFTPDDRNANKGTERGTGMLETSLRRNGAGRSIVVSADGVILCGNKTAEGAASIGLADGVVVDSDGTKLVAVRRTDLHSSDPRARELAIADNRVSECNYAVDTEVLLALAQDDVNVGMYYSAEELDALAMGAAGAGEWEDAAGKITSEDKPPFRQVTFTLHESQFEQVERALAKAKRTCDFAASVNENSNGNALATVCEAYVNG